MSAQLTLFESTVSSTSVIGLEVKMPWRPCRCGAVMATIGTGAGPHHARLECSVCNRYRGWLSAESYQFITAVVDEFGRPEQPITIKSQNSRISANEPVV